MARIMLSLMSTCLISTLATLMPQASVCASRICWMSWLSLSRSASISSSSCLPSTERSVVCASWLVAAKKFSTWMTALSGSTTEIDHRIDLDRDVVARDHVLARHVVHDGAQVDAHHLLDDRDHQDEARPAHAGKAAEREHHGTLVFAQDADARIKENDDDGGNDKVEDGVAENAQHDPLLMLGVTRSIPAQSPG